MSPAYNDNWWPITNDLLHIFFSILLKWYLKRIHETPFSGMEFSARIYCGGFFLFYIISCWLGGHQHHDWAVELYKRRAMVGKIRLLCGVYFLPKGPFTDAPLLFLQWKKHGAINKKTWDPEAIDNLCSHGTGPCLNSFLRSLLFLFCFFFLRVKCMLISSSWWVE